MQCCGTHILIPGLSTVTTTQSIGAAAVQYFPLLKHTYTTIRLLPMKLLLKQYEGTSHQSQRKVNEAAEVTLGSVLLIAAFEARAETRTHDRFSLGLRR